MSPEEATKCLESKAIFLENLDGALAHNPPRGKFTDSVRTFVEHARNKDWTNKEEYNVLRQEYAALHKLIKSMGY